MVGMAGEIADQACRLFSLLFYESLLRDGQLAFAASQGRRLGIIGVGNSDPRTSVDWALPTIFLSPSRKSSSSRCPAKWQLRPGAGRGFSLAQKIPGIL